MNRTTTNGETTCSCATYSMFGNYPIKYLNFMKPRQRGGGFSGYGNVYLFLCFTISIRPHQIFASGSRAVSLSTLSVT